MLKNLALVTLVGLENKMLKAVRSSITTGVFNFIVRRSKVVPLSSQYVTQSVLLQEDNFSILQEDGSEILLE